MQAQEFGVAQKVKVLIGPHTYDEFEFEQALRNHFLDLSDGDFESQRGNLWHEVYANFKSRTEVSYRKYISTSSGPWEDSPLFEELSLYRALLASHKFHASDPRDKVYAILGLVRHWLISGLYIQPDYQKPVVHVYAETMRLVSKEQGDLNILLSSWPKWSEAGTEAKYTWLFDLSKERAHDSLWPASLDANSDQPAWCPVKSLQACINVLWKQSEHCLYVSGFNFDKIISVAEISEDSRLAFRFSSLLPGVDTLSQSYSLSSQKPSAALGDLQKDIAIIAEVFAGASDLCQKAVEGEYNPYSLDMQDALERSIFADEYSHKVHQNELWSTGTNLLYFELFKTTENFERIVEIQLLEYRVFLTSGGYIGLGRKSIECDDEVAIIPGISMPVVLRPTAQKGYYHFNNEAFIHGIMYGEFQKVIDCEELQPREYVFV